MERPSLLYRITQTVLGEEHRSLSSPYGVAHETKRAVEEVAGGCWARCSDDNGDSDGWPADSSESRTACRGCNVFSCSSGGVVARLTCSSFWFR
jgi:hypothetical protein